LSTLIALADDIDTTSQQKNEIQQLQDELATITETQEVIEHIQRDVLTHVKRSSTQQTAL
jgi:hypothetical protein